MVVKVGCAVIIRAVGAAVATCCARLLQDRFRGPGTADRTPRDQLWSGFLSRISSSGLVTRLRVPRQDTRQVCMSVGLRVGYHVRLRAGTGAQAPVCVPVTLPSCAKVS